MNTSTVAALSNSVMVAVARSGAIRSANQDADVAVRVMREELKAFLFDAKYEDERSLALTGGHQLAVASLVAECVARILKERVPA